MKRYIVAFIVFLPLMVAAQSRPAQVPATPHPIEVEQPDGTKLTIRLHGDERGHSTTTTDGFVIVQNDKGYYCYAQIARTDKLVASKRKAHNSDNRSCCEKRFLKKQASEKRLKRDMLE